MIQMSPHVSVEAMSSTHTLPLKSSYQTFRSQTSSSWTSLSQHIINHLNGHHHPRNHYTIPDIVIAQASSYWTLSSHHYSRCHPPDIIIQDIIIQDLITLDVIILEPHLAVVEAVCPVVEAGGHNHPVLGRRGHGLVIPDIVLLHRI